MEDVITHVCLLVMLAFVLAAPRMPHAAFRPAMIVIAIAVTVIFVRRQGRLNRLVKLMREQREAEAAMAPLMGLPPAPPRMQGSPNGKTPAKVGRKRK